MPDPKSMSAYVRVSRVGGREGDSYISPDVQEETIRAWAKSRGVEIIAVDKDEDESGGTQNRPGLRKAIKRIQDGNSDGIAVAKLNRFARNVSGGIEDIRTIQKAGGTIAFVEEGIDPTGPFGDFLLTILLAVAELELNSVKQGWEVAKARAVQRGVKIGKAPLGYTRDEHGKLTVDPTIAPLITEAFNVAARGGPGPAAVYLKREAPGLAVWEAATVRKLLARRVYLGHLIFGKNVLLDAHPPLTTPAVFELANSHGATPRGPSGAYILSGFAKCASCGSSLIGASTGSGDDKRRTYRCSKYRRGGCDAPTMTLSEPLELLVLNAALDAGVMVPATYSSTEATEADATEAAAAGLRAARQILDDFTARAELQEVLGADRYFAMLVERQTAVDDAEAAYEEAAGQAAAALPVVPFLMSLASLITETIENEELPPEAPWVFIKRAVRTLTVAKGRQPLADRVTIEWGEFPTDPTPGAPLEQIAGPQQPQDS